MLKGDASFRSRTLRRVRLSFAKQLQSARLHIDSSCETTMLRECIRSVSSISQSQPFDRQIAVFKLRRCSCAAAAAVAARRYRRVRTPRGSAKATSSRVANKWYVSIGVEKPLVGQQRGIVAIIQEGNVVVQAQSGTGRRVTFCIGTLQRMGGFRREMHTQVLCLASTRELSSSIHQVASALAEYLSIKCAPCWGGKNDVGEMSKSVDESWSADCCGYCSSDSG
ncbi:unnamed protein product [Mesocestoides corti]|uniref:ATP-dependent RNA helicase n=1 Tax=Mesocestoides corti TaxID=53468 RepID=A0A0R3UBY6_MESCO|nr:unnamed protein product [Mesocestoides corti]